MQVQPNKVQECFVMKLTCACLSLGLYDDTYLTKCVDCFCMTLMYAGYRFQWSKWKLCSCGTTLTQVARCSALDSTFSSVFATLCAVSHPPHIPPKQAHVPMRIFQSCMSGYKAASLQCRCICISRRKKVLSQLGINVLCNDL